MTARPFRGDRVSVEQTMEVWREYLARTRPSTAHPDPVAVVVEPEPEQSDDQAPE